ncbi:MAG TPA: hypothetical protein VKD08_16500 [Ignavibacteriaceae bacterium]|nr:hypothetical protein [Ignavibacteriaceae bacterium]
MKVKKFIIEILLLPAIFFIGTGMSQTKTLRSLHSGGSITFTESGHSVTYYKVSKENPTLLLIKGPGSLQIAIRPLVKGPDINKSSSIFYRVDGGERSKYDYNAMQGNSGTKGLKIELSSGEHSIEITTENDAPAAAAKYLFKGAKEKKLKWILLSPSRPNEPVDLVTHENVVHYYRFSEKKPLKIRINGPSELRVLTRFENHFNMKGRIDYRIQVKEDGKVIQTYLLSSVYSEVTGYKQNAKLVPGKAREFYIRVPSGKHTYTFTPLDKDKNTILARVLFPKKDVKLE